MFLDVNAPSISSCNQIATGPPLNALLVVSFANKWNFETHLKTQRHLRKAGTVSDVQAMTRLRYTFARLLKCIFYFGFILAGRLLEAISAWRNDEKKRKLESIATKTRRIRSQHPANNCRGVEQMQEHEQASALSLQGKVHLFIVPKREVENKPVIFWQLAHNFTQVMHISHMDI